MSTEDTSICVGGQLFNIGTTVKRWNQPEGFNGYDESRVEVKETDRKTGKEKIIVIRGKRYNKSIPSRINKIKQFVVHHTGGFKASTAFNTLHNERKLSAQFIINDDGLVYQTIDATDIAWQAGSANGISVGAECVLRPFVAEDPDAYSDYRCNKLGLQPHIETEQILRGRKILVYKMPDKQVDALARVIAGIWLARYTHPLSVLKGELTANRRSPKFPRSNDTIPMYTLSEWDKHIGMILHLHISEDKRDAVGLDYILLEQLVESYFLTLSL